MKVVLVNGSPNQTGCTHRALQEVAKTLEAEGVATELFWVGKSVQGCTACLQCRKKGQCIFKDRLADFIPLAEETDGFIFGSPVYYAGPAGNLQAFMERLFFSASEAMRYKPAASLVSCRRGGATAAFDRLNKFYTIANMPIVSSQYWNMVHGMQPADVDQDLEGLQTMRTLGRNMAWLLNCIAAGRVQGVLQPQPETAVATNFIR